MKKIFSVLFVSALWLSSSTFFATQGITAATGAADARAMEILKQARAAIGPEAKIVAVQGLSVTAKFKRESQGTEASGDIEISMSLPDRILSSEATPLLFAEGKIIMERGLDGEKGWIKARAEGIDNVNFKGLDSEEAHANAGRELMREYPRYLLSLFLTTSPAYPVEFTYAGESTIDGASASVIEAKEKHGFAARLYIDSKTYRLLAMTYSGRMPRPPRRKMARQTELPDGTPAPADEASEKIMNERNNKKASVEAPKDDDIKISFSDYRDVDGVLLPHRIVQTASDGSKEEVMIGTFKINPPLNVEKFKRKS